MATIHTVCQAFIVKENYDTIVKMWTEDEEVRFMVLSKLVRAHTERTEAQYATITIDCDMVVAVQESP